MTAHAIETPAVTVTRRSAANPYLPLVLDVALPFGLYYVCHSVLGWSLVASLVAGSVLPAARSVLAVVRERRVNGLAALMLAVNVAAMVLGFVSGDACLLFAKDSGISSVVAVGILASAFRARRPLMSAGLEPFLTKGDPARVAAWARLTSTSARFQALERRFSLVWGVALLGDCTARVVCAFTVPVSVLSWLSTALVVSAVVVAGIVGGGVASEPMRALIDAETTGAHAVAAETHAAVSKR